VPALCHGHPAAKGRVNDDREETIMATPTAAQKAAKAAATRAASQTGADLLKGVSTTDAPAAPVTSEGGIDLSALLASLSPEQLAALAKAVAPQAAPVPAQRAARGRKAAGPNVDAIIAAVREALPGELSQARDFASGSRGFGSSYKIQVGGQHYQVTGNAVLIKSKPGERNAAVRITASRDTIVAQMDLIIDATMNLHDYGKKGIGAYANGRVPAARGEEYMVGVNVVPYTPSAE
jgi:hypothetical protein